MSTPKNQNAAHAVKPDTHLHTRCSSEDKASWKVAASRSGLKLSPWIVGQLNEAAKASQQVLRTFEKFNDYYSVGHAFMFNGRLVSTRGEAYYVGPAQLVVKIHGRAAAVNVSELRLV